MDFKQPATSILRHPRWKWVAVFIVCELITIVGAVNLMLGFGFSWIGLAAICFFAPGMVVSIIKLLQPKISSKPRSSYEVRRSAWSSVAYAFLGFGWAGGCYLLVLNRPESAIIAWPLLYLCLSIGIVALLQLADRRPILTINAEGVTAPEYGGRTVPWEAISGARIEELGGQETLIIELKDPEKYVSGGSLGSHLTNLVNLELAGLGLVKVESNRLGEVLDYVLSQCEGVCPKNSYDSLIGAIQEPEQLAPKQ